MKKFVLAVIGIALFAMTGVAFAAQVTNNIQVLASVANTCRITTAATNVNFGDYDPMSIIDDTDGVSSIGFRCTKGLEYWTYIQRTNSMSSGSNNLTYQLYTDAGLTTAWATSKSGSGTISLNNQPQSIVINGKITAGQDVPAGSYSENVTVTIEW
jgi:spore coat protein U-like protein